MVKLFDIAHLVILFPLGILVYLVILRVDIWRILLSIAKPVILVIQVN